jgi:hypothetical protein
MMIHHPENDHFHGWFTIDPYGQFITVPNPGGRKLLILVENGIPRSEIVIFLYNPCPNHQPTIIYQLYQIYSHMFMILPLKMVILRFAVSTFASE